MDKQLIVTSIEKIAEYAQGTLVELPPFGPDQPFVARLRRPSMMALAKAGKIPNSLLEAANRMFFGTGGSVKKVDKDSLKEVFEVIDILCDAAFIEPKYSELKSMGIELSDDQYMFVFNFTQKGVKALDSFREQHGDIEDSSAI